MPVKNKISAKPLDKILQERPKRLRCFLRARMESSNGYSGTVRIRNLSERGMGAISGHSFREGELVTVTIPSIGKVSGRVAWAKKGGFGVYFLYEAIDPERARKNDPSVAGFDEEQLEKLNPWTTGRWREGGGVPQH